MGNTRNIQPIATWTPEGEKSMTILALSNFFDYHFDDGSGKVEYKLIGVDSDTGSAVEYFIGTLDIPSSIIQQWGASDDIIWTYVTAILGIILI